MSHVTHLVDLNTQHAWAVRYLIDWRYCERQLRPVRLYTTLLRWFHDPTRRARQLRFATDWNDDALPELPPQLLRNLDALLAVDIRLGPGYPAARFGRFLASLTDGDVFTGGPSLPTLPPQLLDIRPGFAYVYTHWHRWFPHVMPPWPFWVFPTPEENET